MAAPTTSLPEWIGSVRNWDYRYCWLRDSVLTLGALMVGRLPRRSARVARLAAARGWPASRRKLQIMYGVTGDRRLTEYEVPWLPGYEGSTPVRVGNAASDQFQLDVYGETLASLHLMRERFPPEADDDTVDSWPLETALLEYLEGAWHQPDDGHLGGARRPPALHALEGDGVARVPLRGPFGGAVRPPGAARPLAQSRDDIHALVCDEGFDADLGSFTQAFGSTQLDASLLQHRAGRLPASRPTSACVGTVAAIERELLRDGFVLRYRTEHGRRRIARPARACSCRARSGSSNNYVIAGPHARARRSCSTGWPDSPTTSACSRRSTTRTPMRQLGNMPQAFTHLAYVQAARLVTEGVPEQRPF